ncbi:MAG: hypothetical protein WCW26_00465 [Candidatus Buchananbacteria bacterium]
MSIEKGGFKPDKNEGALEKQEALERRSRFLLRLEDMAPMFLEARKKMGLGENIGFGSLPIAHGDLQTIGCLPKIKLSADGGISYDAYGFLGEIYETNLSEEEKKGILINPQPAANQQLRLVSLADPIEEPSEDDHLFYNEVPYLVDAPDDVYAGTIAHELAHCFDDETKIPPEIIKVLKYRQQQEYPDLIKEWHYNEGNHDSVEEDVDLIAAMLGYKQEIITKINFMLDRINRRIKYKNIYVESTIEHLERRKQQVLKYCP